MTRKLTLLVYGSNALRSLVDKVVISNVGTSGQSYKAIYDHNYIDSSQLTRVSNIISFDGQSGTDLYPLPNLCLIKNLLIPCCNNEKILLIVAFTPSKKAT